MDEECIEKLIIYLQCKYTKFADKMAKKVSNGVDCSCEIKNLNLAKIGIRTMNCYRNNQAHLNLTEEEFCGVFDIVDKILCNTCCDDERDFSSNPPVIEEIGEINLPPSQQEPGLEP